MEKISEFKGMTLIVDFLVRAHIEAPSSRYIYNYLLAHSLPGE